MFNVDEVIREAVNIMTNNYNECGASSVVKFHWARKDLVARFRQVIDDNAEIIINDYKERTGGEFD